MTCGTEPDQYRENTILGNKGPYFVFYDLESLSGLGSEKYTWQEHTGSIPVITAVFFVVRLYEGASTDFNVQQHCWGVEAILNVNKK